MKQLTFYYNQDNLFLTPRGAYTLKEYARLIENEVNNKQKVVNQTLVDYYSNHEDDFIDKHGFSSNLN